MQVSQKNNSNFYIIMQRSYNLQVGLFVIGTSFFFFFFDKQVKSAINFNDSNPLRTVRVSEFFLYTNIHAMCRSSHCMNTGIGKVEIND